MSVFAPDPSLLRVLYFMLAVERGYARVQWSPGAEPAEVPEIDSEEAAVRRLITEFDAVELVRGVPCADEGMAGYDFAVVDTDPAEWVELVARMSENRDVLVSAGSRRRRGMGTCDRAAVLWCRTETKKSAELLRRFRPSPTLVLREGLTCRMTALWSLQVSLTYEWLVRANRRLAHKLFAAKKWGEAEFAFNPPGSCLRVGRSRPVPVHCEFYDPAAVYTARQVVGHLKDAPDPNAWREAA